MMMAEIGSPLERALAEVAETWGLSSPTVSAKNAVGDTALHYFAARGDVQSIRLCVEAGADPNVRGEVGNTPLHNAVHSGSVSAVETLLDLGAVKSTKNRLGDLPKDIAQRRGNDCPKRIRRILGVA